MNKVTMRNDVIFFNNGNTAVFSIHGQQVEGLQVPWIQLYFDFLESKGMNIAGLGFTFQMPDGRKAVPIKIKEGWNWKIT